MIDLTLEPSAAVPPQAPISPPSQLPSQQPTPRHQSRLGQLLAAAAVGALVGGGVAGGIVATNVNDNQLVSSTSVASAQPVVLEVSANPIANLVEIAAPSIVSIHNSMSSTDAFGQTIEGEAAGSGFVLSADGTIVTNNHVIDGGTSITVDFNDGTTASAVVVAADPYADLAVLKVERTGLTPLPIGSSDALQVGDQLVAIGNALDLSGTPTVTTGILSASNRSIDVPNGVKLVNLIQTDTAINPGNSGGPLLNMAGEVIGINTAVAGQAQNIGFALAMSSYEPLIHQLSSGSVPDHALMGVATQLAAGATTGVEIMEVTPGSGAAVAGLQIGDVITSVNGTAIGSPDDLSVAIATRQPGESLAVSVVRDGTTQTFTLILGSRS